MLKHLRVAAILMVAFTLLLGIAYPLAVTGLAQALFPAQARGSLIVRDGQVVGSSLIGQSFTQERYFQGRPSATSPAYNAAGSGGSNLGPTSKALAERVRADVAARQADRKGPVPPVPVDLVTSSASGLDPHITPAAAEFQVPRVARSRGLREGAVRELVAANTSGRLFGIIGEPVVNVLELNLALDRLAPERGNGQK
jgi:K+-transporting ATPase ATPase C chain